MPVSDDVIDGLEDQYLDDHLLDLPRYLDVLKLASDPTRFALLDELRDAGNEGKTPDELAAALDLDESEVCDDIGALSERYLVRRWRDSDEGEQGTHMHLEIGGYGLAALDAVEELLEAETRANEYFRSDDDPGSGDDDDGDDSPLTRYGPYDGPAVSAVRIIESGCDDPRRSDGTDDTEDS
ncbi:MULTISPECIES: helix-turn-helix domain-containing protein [Halobacterium]|uniref:helix-turn-helix domain-containing protein n=1 Tax=Halobacterium TaxID=2239 RepID=UPI00073E6BBA|nr:MULTISPECIES: helix-turn-helix domain-containing protein [Halobacterium]MCG1001882.1 helix-turn-helix domain-containing protein [Halobacterium noricense]